MFFVRKESIATTLGAQKEFTAAARRGIQFAARDLPNGNKVWHYLWPEDQIEPSIKASLPTPADAEDAPEYYIWSQEVKQGELVGDPLISPYYSGAGPWQDKAAELFAAASSNAL